MERTLKSKAHSEALVWPAADGWRLLFDGGKEELFADLQHLAAVLPAAAKIHLALPLSAVLMHRITLPSTSQEEISAMMQLQLEKLLPFPQEEVTSGFYFIERGEAASTILTLSVKNSRLEALVAPLIERGIYPCKVSVFAAHTSRMLSDEGAVSEATSSLFVYREHDCFVFAVSRAGALSHAQLIEGGDAATVVDQLPALILAAELDGVQPEFDAIYLEESCSAIRPALESLFGMAIENFRASPPAVLVDFNLVPSTWLQARNRAERVETLKKRLGQVALLYVCVLAAAVAYLFWSNARLVSIGKKLSEAQPDIDFIADVKARWAALAPAVAPEYYPIELLLQVYNCLPSPEVRLTKFTQNMEQFIVEGEAPTANQAIEFSEQLKKNAVLSRYNLEIGPPVILPNDHAQFRVFGKL